jgi:hypothetical protein
MRPIGLRRLLPAPRFTRRSDLRPIVLRMISTNSLAAFTAEVSRRGGPLDVRGAAAPGGLAAPAGLPERRLEALPPAPAAPPPRGSLLDLRV